ncbi:hypothetical protein [Helicobacter suis]|uniref:hypothetical protein n=1 Tax=Helicobacter suis TaxID=104628 RepID=UPI002493834C|nr:hypothetical protein [Helicobacter suis]
MFAVFVSRVAHVEVGYASDSSVLVNPLKLSVLSIGSLIAGKKIRRLFNARFDALVLGDADEVLKRLSARNFSNILSYQYDDFVSKCQKHVKIHVPNMGSGVSPTSTFYASFHWKF